MKNTLFLLIGFVLVLVQSNLFRVFDLLSIPGLVPSLTLPMILFMGVREFGAVKGAGLAFLLGYLNDLVGMTPVGLSTFTFVGLFLVARTVGNRFATQTFLTQAIVSFGFALVHSSLKLALIAIFSRRDPYVPRTLLPFVLPHTISTTLVSPFILYLCQRLDLGGSGGSVRTLRRSAS